MSAEATSWASDAARLERLGELLLEVAPGEGVEPVARIGPVGRLGAEHGEPGQLLRAGPAPATSANADWRIRS